MVDKFVAYWTVGWNKFGVLRTIPVLSRLKNISESGFTEIKQHVTDNVYDAAKELKMTLILVDDLFGYESIGQVIQNSQRNWYALNGVVHANDQHTAQAVVDEINQILSKEKGKH